MWVETLQLRQFRNYDALNLELGSGTTVIVGENASGKTNILEALCLLSHAKSPRTGSDKELIQWQKDFATLKAQIQVPSQETQAVLEAQLILGSTQRLKTVFKVHGSPLKSRSQVIGILPTVTFFLNDLLMVRGVPEDRRSALDAAITQFDTTYLPILMRYNRTRQQKSQLLKQDPLAFDANVLTALNRQLLDLGTSVTYSRLQYLQAVFPTAVSRYETLSQGQQALSWRYASTVGTLPLDTPMETIRALLSEAMEANQAEEIQRRQVLIGPHRDDMVFLLDEKEARSYASQGQQRSVALAFKLAELDLIQEKYAGDPPVLLLDDVMAELDLNRQAQLLSFVHPNQQVILTTTHLDDRLAQLTQRLADTQVFQVSQGCVTPSKIQVGVG